MGLSWPFISNRFQRHSHKTQTKKEMGRIDEDEEWPTLCLKIQDPADVAQGIRILRGGGKFGKNSLHSIVSLFLYTSFLCHTLSPRFKTDN